EIEIRAADLEARCRAEVRDVTVPLPVSFAGQVIPVLSKAGCNAGSCHGKAEGQNGFRLSVFGYDSVADHQAIVMEGRGRRVFPAAPAHSLLLRKAIGTSPHGGGRRIEADSRWYRLLERWITEGAGRNQIVEERRVNHIEVQPAEITLLPRSQQRLRVVAVRSDGVQTGVTAECDFQSNHTPVAEVDHDGLVTATEVPGEAGILVRYRGHVAVCRINRPLPNSEFEPRENLSELDQHVWNKLQALGLPASDVCSDEVFLRRVFLDTIGTLPTSDESRSFLADTAADKRAQLVERLLHRPEYADYWAQKWADLLQVDKDILTPLGAAAMTRWIHTQVEQNLPYDQFVDQILTAAGPTLGETPAGFFQVQKDPKQLAQATSQLFLGVRIECAQCHHHPFEKWDQSDYVALAGFFTGVTRKNDVRGGQKIGDSAGQDLTHPRTGDTVRAAGLDAEPISTEQSTSRRAAYARWVTSSDNPFFARTIANRLWAHYLGRGIVEPVDDLRATNPATNEPLLNALTDLVIQSDFDLKQVTRTILSTQAYQLSCEPVGSNAADEQNYSHFGWKPLPAEVLLDAISQTTDVPEDFPGWPRGYRAIQIWDNKLPSPFMEVFGRPTRQTVCACERGTEPGIAQALHLLNAPRLANKIDTRDGRAQQLAESNLTNEAIVEELCLVTLCRFPSDAERSRLLTVFTEAPSRQEAVEDILWTLLNTKEFLFNH
ncbi:MAG: DUF1549 domain-containing protein, partial [Planctomycetaceae bacterium]|nr:DUF1549 domain-containing protein [Planctomycetaceae bacterium]